MDITSPGHEARPVSAPRGSELNTLGWQQEGALRMLMNNLDPRLPSTPTTWSSTAAPAAPPAAGPRSTRWSPP